jgi:5-methylcytosine-specific restriction endonuclease McrA
MKQKWTKTELELTLAFYLFDKKNSSTSLYLKKFSEDLQKITNTKRTPSTIGLRVANYHYYDADFNGKGLFGGGRAAKSVFETYTIDLNFHLLKEKYIAFIENYVQPINKIFYPNNDAILSSFTPSFKRFIGGSNLNEDTLKEDRENKIINDELSLITPIIFEDQAMEITSSKISSKLTYERNLQVAINSLAHSNYKCEIDPNHKTFKRKNKDEPYLELHHLIPLSKQKLFKFSLDVEANVVSLCSTCHNEIHYGAYYINLIDVLYKKRRERLIKTSIDVSFNTLIKFY